MNEVPRLSNCNPSSASSKKTLNICRSTLHHMSFHNICKRFSTQISTENSLDISHLHLSLQHLPCNIIPSHSLYNDNVCHSNGVIAVALERSPSALNLCCRSGINNVVQKNGYEEARASMLPESFSPLGTGPGLSELRPFFWRTEFVWPPYFQVSDESMPPPLLVGE